MTKPLTARELLALLLTIPENRLDDAIFMICHPWYSGYLGRVGLGNGEGNDALWFYSTEYVMSTGYGIIDDVTYL